MTCYKKLFAFYVEKIVGKKVEMDFFNIILIKQISVLLQSQK
jgi:hypothetical protein